MIINVLSVIERIKLKQEERPSKTTKSNSSECEQQSTDFIVAMENYFTLPRAIAKLHDLSVGCIGTARFCIGWPSKELRDVN
eukprot:3544204-Ditylum_brightwellii.AAC.1